MKKLTAILLVCVFLAGCAQRVVFTDVPEGSPLAESVERLAKRGVWKGIPLEELGADEPADRGLFAFLMWGIAGRPKATGEGFRVTYIDETDYYYSAVYWCVENGYVEWFPKPSEASTPFGPVFPYEKETRESVYDFLYRYAQDAGKVTQSKEIVDLSGFADAGVAEEYCRWLIKNGIVLGNQRDDGLYLDLDEPILRGELVCLLDRFLTVIEAAE